MLRQLRYSFCVSRLSYNEQTLKHVEPFKMTKQNGLSLLFNFSNKVNPSLWSRIFPGNQPHYPLLKLYLDYIKKREYEPLDMAYEYIEYNLRRNVMSEQIKKKIFLSNYKLKVLDSRLLQHTQMMGLFIQRKYNLNFESYLVQVKRPDVLQYKLKDNLRQDALRLYEKIVRQYVKDGQQAKYGKNVIAFGKEGSINRYLYEMVIDLQITLTNELDGNSITYGGEGPTTHLVQIESYFDSVSNMEQFFLTDVDFLLKGNPHFRDSLAN